MASAFSGVLADFRYLAERDKTFMATASHAEIEARRDELLLDVGEETARFLGSLIVARAATYVVELGTSKGFSTLFLADAVRETGGILITFETCAEKQSFAKEKISQAGLSQFVDFRLGDAVAGIADLEDRVDFAFIDLWKDLYVTSFEALTKKLLRGGIVAADNILAPQEYAEMARSYRRHVATHPSFTSVLLPIGQGIELSCRSER